MKNQITILLVEDEKGISNFIKAVLQGKAYCVINAFSAEEAISLCSSCCPDLMLLDLGLPDMDGMKVIEAVRKWSEIPIIVVSARGNEKDKVLALDMGADDYVTKPFGSEELLARIRTAIRHKMQNVHDEKITIGEMQIDVDKRKVLMNGLEVHFTPIEYRILLLLAQNAGKVLTVGSIIREIWGPYEEEANTLRVNMANIRRKIEKNPAEPIYVKTEIGVGYRMVEEIAPSKH